MDFNFEKYSKIRKLINKIIKNSLLSNATLIR